MVATQKARKAILRDWQFVRGNSGRTVLLDSAVVVGKAHGESDLAVASAVGVLDADRSVSRTGGNCFSRWRADVSPESIDRTARKIRHDPLPTC